MSDIDDNEDDGPLNVEIVPPEPVVLMDETCWVPDPDALHPDNEAEGVLALMLRGGCLFYFDGELRQWLNVEDKGPKKARLTRVQ